MHRLTLFTLMFTLIGSTSFARSQQPSSAAVPVPGSGQPGGLQPGGIPVSGVGQPVQVDPILLGHLNGWETRMKDVFSIICELDNTQKNLILKREMKRVGKITIHKPNYAHMKLLRAPDMIQDDKDFQVYISDGKSMYEYNGLQKEVKEFKYPPGGGIQGNLIFEFMSGAMTTQDILKRFDVKFVKEDQYYIHLEIKSKLPNDRQEFERMQLALVSPKAPQQFSSLRYLPASVIMYKDNDRESETWQFTRNPQVNERLTLESFKPIPLPKDWKYTLAEIPKNTPSPQGQTAPRVTRP